MYNGGPSRVVINSRGLCTETVVWAWKDGVRYSNYSTKPQQILVFLTKCRCSLSKRCLENLLLYLRLHTFVKGKKKKEWPQKENCPWSFLFALSSALVETTESPAEQRDDKEFKKKKRIPIKEYFSPYCSPSRWSNLKNIKRHRRQGWAPETKWYRPENKWYNEVETSLILDLCTLGKEWLNFLYSPFKKYC